MAIHIIEGSGAPGFTPDAVGQHYVDTANGDEYFSTGTSSSADWILRGTGSNLVDETNPQLGANLDVNDYEIQGKPAATPTSGGNNATIKGSDGGATSGTGGAVYVKGGDGLGSPFSGGGAAILEGGTPIDGDGGNVFITGTAAAGTGYGGDVNIAAGNAATSGEGGDITLLTGQGEDFLNGGDFSVTTGSSGLNAGQSGDIFLTCSSPRSQTGAPGEIHLTTNNVDFAGSSANAGDLEISLGYGGEGPGTGARGGGDFNAESGRGGDSDYVNNGNNDADNGGSGGDWDITLGRGGHSVGSAPGVSTGNGGSGGDFEVTCGAGGNCDGLGNPGQGGDVVFTCGAGGTNSNDASLGNLGGVFQVTCGNSSGALVGGGVSLTCGQGGPGGGGGAGGDIDLTPGGSAGNDLITSAGVIWVHPVSMQSVQFPAEVRLEDLQGGETGYVGFRAPSNVSAATTGGGTNTTWTLPEGDGSDGATMITDGAGTLSWSGQVPLERIVVTPGIGTHTLFFYDMAFLPAGALPGFGVVRLKGEVTAFDPTSGAPPGEGGFGDFDVTAVYNAPGAPVAIAPPVATFAGLPTAAGSGLAVALTAGPDGISLDFVQAVVATPIIVRLNVTVHVTV